MKKIIILLSFVLAMGIALPAKAFYLEVPKILQTTWDLWHSESTSAQETGSLSTEPVIRTEVISETTASTETCVVNGVVMSGPCSNYSTVTNGEAVKTAEPVPPVEQYIQMATPVMNSGPSAEEMRAQEERSVQDMKRHIKQIERNIKEFEILLNKEEKKGTAISAEIKDKIVKAKELIVASLNATTISALKEVDTDELQNIMNDLEEYRRNVLEAAQRLAGMKRGIRGMNTNLKMFEKQIVRLKKQNIMVPAEILDNVDKLKKLIAAINTAKTWEEAENAGMEDMQEMMQSLDESRQRLEMLARWPQTLKQVNREIANLTRVLKRSKIMTNSLAKKEIDVSSHYSAFEEAVKKLKTARDEAASKIKEGDSEGAFDILENDFFGQMEDVWQNQRIIETMNNLGRFNSEFKKGIAEAQWTVRVLKKKGLNVAELEEILSQSKAKGAEILAMLKTKDVDEEEILSLLDELENLRQQFEEQMRELNGQDKEMPWENGPQQFRKVEMSPGVVRYLPSKPAPESAPAINGGGAGGETCNINGKEMPGACSNYQSGAASVAPAGI